MNQCRLCFKKLSDEEKGYSWKKEDAVFTLTLNGPAIYHEEKCPPIILTFKITLCFDCAQKVKHCTLFGK